MCGTRARMCRAVDLHRAVGGKGVSARGSTHVVPGLWLSGPDRITAPAGAGDGAERTSMCACAAWAHEDLYI